MKHGEIKKVQKRYLLKESREARTNIENLNNARKAVIDFLMNILQEHLKQDAKQKKKGTGLKILNPKQMVQVLPIAILKIKPGNNSESLLNEIRQIVYSLYQSKEITKKVYNNIIKSIKV